MLIIFHGLNRKIFRKKDIKIQDDIPIEDVFSLYQVKYFINKSQEEPLLHADPKRISYFFFEFFCPVNGSYSSNKLN